ncbi:MAG: helix-turn-helix domain-containing protein [Clostridia bacterium]|nr:helix-turn-helix domain-containing protein [Clostridia bacterium]
MKEYRSSNLISDPSGIHVFFCRCSKNEDSHVHDFSEIVYVCSGRARQTVNDWEYEVCRGDLIFINVGSVHRFSPIEDFSYVNLCFDPRVIVDRVLTEENAFAVLQLTAFDELRRENDEHPVCFSGEEARRVEDVLFGILGEYSSHRAFRSTVIESLMNVLLVTILRKLVPDSADAPNDVFRELSEFIRTNPGENHSLVSIAKKCFYNPSYFSRVFKEKFGVSFTEYVNRCRIDRAVVLLGDPALSVDAVADASGFGSRSSFYRVFTRLVGMTPSEWRQREREKNK